MAPPLLPVPAPVSRRRGTQSIINYDIKSMKLTEEQKRLERLEQSREEFYARINHNEPWFGNAHQRPIEFPLLSSDFPSVPTFAWDLYSDFDYYTGITDSKLEFTASYSQSHSPPANNIIDSAPSTSTSCSSPRLSPVPKLESPALSMVELPGAQMANAQAAFSYLHMPTPPGPSISKEISFHQPDQKQFGNLFHSVQYQHKDSCSDLTRLLQLDAPWAFS